MRTVDEFDDVRDGDILVCQMTNPAWVVLFTKIAGLVTDTGGTTSHPAVLAREFGIPAVVGTSVATQRIVTGDRLKVDGSSGQVEIVRDASARPGRRVQPGTAPRARSAAEGRRRWPAPACSRGRSSPTRFATGSSRASSTATIRPIRGSSRRRWHVSSGPVRRPFARRCAGSRGSGSWRSRRSAAPASGARRGARSSRPTASARRSNRWPRGWPSRA